MKFLVLFCVLAIISQIAHAETTNENVVIVKPTDAKAIIDGSSEFHRINKKFMILGQPIGVGPTASITTGIAAGYFFDRNHLILVDYTSGPGFPSYSSYSTDVFSAKSFGVHYKQFVANSFYYRVGIDQRWIENAYSYSGSSTENDAHISFKGTSTGLSVAIGNQWQLGTFTLGCDWIGYTQPFSSSVSEESLTGRIDSYDRASLEKSKQSYLADGQLQAVRFYLGASF